MMPDADIISVVGTPVISSDQGDIDLVRLLRVMNQRIEYLYDRDHVVGHSYFLNITSYQDLEHIFLARLIPLLQEYFYDDWEKIQIVFADLDTDGEGESYSVRDNAIIKCRDIVADDYMTAMTDQDLANKRLYVVPENIEPASILKIYEGITQLTSGALVLREYEHAGIGTLWDATRRSVTRREVALLDLHQKRTGRKLFKLGYKSIQATNWVGVIGLGSRCIEVVPKIDEPDELRSRENLIYMISKAGLVPLAVADQARLANTNKPLLEAYLELYVRHLAHEWRKGQIKQYVLQEENRSSLKGKLIFPVQLRENLLHQERFFTASDEFTPDNSVSQLLKAALRICHQQLFSDTVAADARNLLQDFGEVTDIQQDVKNILYVQIDRRISRFEQLINMAKFILKDVSPGTAKSGDSVYSLMFDMNIVFEKFIFAEMKLALRNEPLRVKSQIRGRSLLRKDGRRQFALRPDIGVYQNKNSLCIIDTKWKRLSVTRPYQNVSQADIYQMYAYGKEYDFPKVILLYPRFGNIPLNAAEYLHNDGAPPKYIQICTIDVSEPLSHHNVRKRLKERLHKPCVLICP